MNVFHKITGPIRSFENHLDSYDEKVFRRFVLLFYFLFAAVNIINHEMWLDELQPWSIACSSNSLHELFSNIRFEGHPPLWYLMLYALSQVTHNPAAMQSLHLAIAVTSAYVFLRFAPFTRLQRLLFVFGYFPLYEYATISRSYSTEMLLLFLLCAVIQNAGKRKFLTGAVILFLLLFTNLYGFVITAAFCLMFTLQYASERNLRVALHSHKWQTALLTILVPAGLFISAYVTMPREPNRGSHPWVTSFNFERAEKVLMHTWKAYAPIPEQKLHFWNSNILPGRTLPNLLSLLILCLACLHFARNRKVLLLFILSTFFILGFQYSKHIGQMRHFGHLYIIFIVCLWLFTFYDRQSQIGKPITGIINGCSKTGPGWFVVLLVIQVIAGLEASAIEWTHPFSQSKNAAAYLVKQELAGLPMVGDSDISSAAVAMWLRRSIYFPDTNRVGQFIMWDSKAYRDVNGLIVVEKARELSEAEHSDVVIILNYPLQQNADSVTKLTQFKNGIIRWEEFYLYLLKHQK